jgi:hypothetical protein
MKKAGRARAETFTWDKAARKLADILGIKVEDDVTIRAAAE